MLVQVVVLELVKMAGPQHPGVKYWEFLHLSTEEQSWTREQIRQNGSSGFRSSHASSKRGGNGQLRATRHCSSNQLLQSLRLQQDQDSPGLRPTRRCSSNNLLGSLRLQRDQDSLWLRATRRCSTNPLSGIRTPCGLVLAVNSRP